jgi:hypothetical protein
MDLFAFLSWQFVFFSLGVMAVIFVVRTILEYFFSALKTSNLWNSLILTVSPVILGGIMAYLFKAYPYSTGLTSSGDHILFGAVAGLFSGLIFRVIKTTLGQQIVGLISSAGINLPGVTNTIPAPNVPAPPDAPPPNR